VIDTMCAEEPAARRRCRIIKPIRDKGGRVRFKESAEIIKDVENLGRQMYLVRFDDGTTTFLFPDEVEILD